MDGTGRLRRNVAGYAIGPAELAEQALHAVAILFDVRVCLGVGALEVSVRHHRRAAMTRTDHVNHVDVALTDNAIPVDVKEVQSGCGAPMTEQAGLHVVEGEAALKQRIVLEVDLADRK